MEKIENGSLLESLLNDQVGKPSSNLKGGFIKAGQWFLDLTREFELEINHWKAASARASEKDPTSFLIKKYLIQAEKKQAQKQAMLKFYTICETIVSDFENQLWLKEQFETIMLLQLAALKQGRHIDVMKSVSLILKSDPERAEKVCQ